MDDTFTCEVSRIRGETFQKIITHGTKSCQDMEKLWCKIFGNNRDVVIERYHTIQKHITELFDEMVKEETEHYNDRRIELSSLVEMSSELRHVLSIKIELPFEVNLDGCNLRKQIKELKNYLEKYQKIKEDRLRCLQQYKLEEEKLCEKLGEYAVYSSYNDVPSEAKLKEIKSRLSSLNAELSKRSKIFKSLVCEIEELVRDLEIGDDLDHEQRHTLTNHDDVILSEGKLEALEAWKFSLVEERDAQEKLISSLRDQTMTLWNRLDISPEEREDVFVRTYKTCGKTVLEIWMNELKRCEQLKKANMKMVILRLRETITKLWDDCHIDAEERRFFRDYFSEDFTEELLESHEREEMNLRKYYEETKDLYSLAEEWFQLWNKMISLESRSNNSERLNNRGGQLLKEEKERKAVQKKLPKVEEKLEARIANFEKKHDKPFLYEGQPLMELIAEYWENRRVEKENEKEVRKNQNQTRVTPMGKSTTPMAKSASRLVPPSPLSTTRKRGRPMTPLENIVANKPTAKRQLQMPSDTKSETQRRRSRSHDPAGRYEPKTLRSASANSSVVSYAGFQNYIENRSKTTSGMTLRSSISPTRGGTGGHITRSNSILFKTPTSAAKSASKRTRYNNFGSSKILRPMIN